MTREEAKKRLDVWIKCRNCPADKRCYDKHLNTVCEYYKFVEDTPLEEAIKVAISALSENKGDLIGRQAVINAIANTCFWLSADNWEELTGCINSIPSVENTGEWKRISPAGIYECSCCGQNVMTSDIECYKFCHGCGARMKGGECE